MKRIYVYLSAILALTLIGPAALAATGWSLRPSVFYAQFDTDGETIAGESELNRTFYDIKLGYNMGSGFYLGALYSIENTDLGSADSSRNSYGATLGYDAPMGFFVHFTYFISTEFNDFGDNTEQAGSGTQIDLGYIYNVNANFAIGPQFSIKNFSYDEQEPNGGGTAVDGEAKYDNVVPSLVFAFMF